MKDNDVEKRIVASLEDGGEKSPRVLDAARAEMRRNKRSIWSRPAFRYALVGMMSVFICLAIVLPIVSMRSFSAAKVVDYANDSVGSSDKSSLKPESKQTMYDYLTAYDVDVMTFDRLSADTTEAASYVVTETRAQTKSGEIVAVSEVYRYGTEEITVSVLLVSDAGIREELFGGFLSSWSVSTVSGTEVRYSFDPASGSGRATFTYRGKEFFTTFAVENESAMLAHLQVFLAQ